MPTRAYHGLNDQMNLKTKGVKQIVFKKSPQAFTANQRRLVWESLEISVDIYSV